MSNSLPEIVVTAKKQDSTVLQALISITAAHGAELSAVGIHNAGKMAAQTTDVSIRSAAPDQNELEVRGLMYSGGAVRTVGYYLDESPLSPPARANSSNVVVNPNLFNLEWVDVLVTTPSTILPVVQRHHWRTTSRLIPPSRSVMSSPMAALW